MKFKNWLEAINTLDNDLVDDTQINRVYDKTKIAISLVRMYSKATNKKLLNNISTIANLVSGAYGLYNSKYNKKVLSKVAADKIRFKFGEEIIKNNQIHNIPEVIIKKYLPEISDRDIVPSDVIFINVSRIVRELGDTVEAVIEIASTIIHESTHEKEREEKGYTNEIAPQNEEKLFKIWIKNNPIIKNKIMEMMKK